MDVPVSCAQARLTPSSFFCWVPQAHFEYLVSRGWAQLSDTNLDLIKTHSSTGLVEFGAGSGYVADLLRQKGVAVEAFDLMDEDFEDGGSNTFLWTWKDTDWIRGVQRGGLERMQERHETHSLLLVWPKGPFAFETLRRYSGKCLIYVGENRGGLTADRSFFDLVEDNWNLVEKQPIVNFAEQRGFVFVFERRPPLAPKQVVFEVQIDAFQRVQRLASLCARYWMDRGFYNSVEVNLRANISWLESFGVDCPELKKLLETASSHLRIGEDEDPFRPGDFSHVSSYHHHMPRSCIRCGVELEEKLVWVSALLDFRRTMRCYSCWIQCHGIGQWSCFQKSESAGKPAICWRVCTEEFRCPKHK